MGPARRPGSRSARDRTFLRRCTAPSLSAQFSRPTLPARQVTGSPRLWRVTSCLSTTPARRNSPTSKRHSASDTTTWPPSWTIPAGTSSARSSPSTPTSQPRRPPSRSSNCRSTCTSWASANRTSPGSTAVRSAGSSAPDSTAASAAPPTNTTVCAEPPSTTAAAVDLVRRGLAVFPLPPGGRRPAESGWHARCLTEPSRVRAVWREGDNIGVGCRASRVWLCDLRSRGSVRKSAGHHAVRAVVASPTSPLRPRTAPHSRKKKGRGGAARPGGGRGDRAPPDVLARRRGRALPEGAPLAHGGDSPFGPVTRLGEATVPAELSRAARA
ncbi:bifunctional DNA primase/polymerase [Streptomyces sp. NPDC052415]|uniref:bifunctional DNA primase/polymerase n=1 Tax=Streptomyces sp. NPDC052415 TaxID=3365690 RepID=UPI0037D5820D